MSPDMLKTALADHNQQHLVEHLAALNPEDRQVLEGDLQTVDLGFVSRVFKASLEAAAVPSTSKHVKPAQGIQQLKDTSSEQREEWKRLGFKLLAEGKAAVLLLAGGQGTRLGSSLPKGCYDVGLPSKKSLFQLQAEKVLRLQQLAAAAFPDAASEGPKPLFWYIMTSPFTHEATLQHFEEHAYFGLSKSQVVLFQQGFLPCLTPEGAIILETNTKVSKAPDGNGGLYMSLKNTGCLDHMRRHGVECLDCYCVDNILVQPGNPVFLGHCYSQGAQCGAKVVSKAYPTEKVGVFATRDGALQVVEYSELPPPEASAEDPTTGDLFFKWANLCMHYFSVAWLEQVSDSLQKGAAYHIAKKNIPSKDDPVQGIKLELFIFDTFPMAEKVALLEIVREEEFSPVKNAPGSPTDSPDTARAHVLALHKRWVEAAGGTVSSTQGVEVSPLLSYGGEGLEATCQGKVFPAAWSDELQTPRN